VNIPGKLEEVSVLLYEVALVPALKYVAHAAMTSVEAHGVGCVQAAHELAQRAGRRFDQEMSVVRHENISMDHSVPAVSIVAEKSQVSFPVRIVPEDALAVVATTDDVVHAAGKLNPWTAGHTNPPSWGEAILFRGEMSMSPSLT